MTIHSTQSNDSIRLFVALPIPAPIAETLSQWVQGHQQELPFRKWVHQQDYHITLQFLGDTKPEHVEKLKAALQKIAVKPFTLILNSADIFGALNSPRVLWSAVNGELERLHLLQKLVLQATSALGYVPEKRSYNPHITLARRYSSSGELKHELLQSAPKNEQWLVDRFVLMKSNMNQSPMYEVLSEFPFEAVVE